MHAAQHDAVNGARPRYETYASTLRDRRADAEAAAAAAAHEVLVAFFPANRAALDERLAKSLSAVPDGDAEDAGVALGRAVGDVVLEARANDGYGTRGSVQPHARTRNLGTDAAGVRADARTAVSERDAVHASRTARSSCRLRRPRSRAGDTPVTTTRSSASARTSARRRTADQTHVAHFWVEPSPSGWSRVGNLVSARYRYDLHRTARLQALLNMAMADGFVVGWYQKRHFAFWRPVTAIRKADTDGNPRTAPDPSWMSLRPTPPLPDYPSTHSLLGGAAAEVLRQFTGTERLPVLHGLGDLDTAGDAAVLEFVHARRTGERRVARARRLPLPFGDRNRRRGRA